WPGGVATLNSWRIVVSEDPVVISWTPGENAASQDVYFSDNLADVTDGVALLDTVAGDVDSLEVGALEMGTTYYWQVNASTEDGTVYTGDIWSFSTGSGNVLIDKRVADGDDDAEEHILDSGKMEGLGSSDLELGYEGSSDDPANLQTIGIRWTDISLAAGAEILEAWVQFSADDVDNSRHEGPVNLVIQGELSPDPVAFSSADGDITARPTTEAAVNWEVPQWMSVHEQGPDEQTPDITSIVAEIIGQEEWASGNALVLTFADDPCNPSAGTREAESENGGGSSHGPLLHIVSITEAAGNPSPADGAADVAQDADLSWSPGFTGAARDVYFGTDENPPKLETTTGTSWALGKLDTSTTYYWKIDEYDADGNKTEGAVWSFTTIIGEATDPDPADGAVEVALDAVLSWTPGATAVASEIYFGVGDDLALMGTTAESSFDTSLVGGLKVGNTYSWRVDSIEEDGTVHVGDVWTFASLHGKASEPDPADGAVLEQTFALLQWTAGRSAASHDVYISDNMDDVVAGAEAAFVGNQTATEITAGLEGSPIPGGLVGATYYWRVDAVEDDPNVVHEGDIWSFTVPPIEAYDPSPADAAENVDAAGVTLSWTAGLGAKLHSVYFGDDLDTVTNAAGAPPLPMTTFDPGPLEPGKTYYWRVDEFNPPANVVGPVWSFTTPPAPEPEPEPEPEPLAKAADPTPADGADISGTFTTLGWTGADGAVSHELYISTSLDDVTAGAEAASAGSQTDTVVIVGLPVPGMPVPDGLVIGATYYWRVDEVAEDGSTTEGDVWSFTVAL
ncbi:MAG: hypothetical protein ACYTFQ_20485, partial [Planctomycetota bacterium]